MYMYTYKSGEILRRQVSVTPSYARSSILHCLLIVLQHSSLYLYCSVRWCNYLGWLVGSFTDKCQSKMIKNNIMSIRRKKEKEWSDPNRQKKIVTRTINNGTMNERTKERNTSENDAVFIYTVVVCAVVVIVVWVSYFLVLRFFISRFFFCCVLKHLYNVSVVRHLNDSQVKTFAKRTFHSENGGSIDLG